ncbi:MAG: hypothetical protein K1X72_13485 [Pyrinomonadaceae bacterium]|nr:hypothetical protein [Pyrinomonadaceae bacterium]
MPNEDWQVQVNQEIISITLEELKDWVKTGKLHPNQPVKIKNLNWVEANKILALQKLFEAQETKEAKRNSARSKSKSETSENSFLSKFFAKSAETKNNQSKTKSKSSAASPKADKKNELGNKIAGYILIGIAIVLPSVGGSFVWVYFLRTPPTVDEKKITELVTLETKLLQDKNNLKIKYNQVSQNAQLTQETSALDTQFNNKRRGIVQNEQVKQQDSSFYTYSLISLAILAIAFLLFKFVYKPKG